MDAEDALALFWDQEEANVPIPQFSDSDLPESDNDDTVWLSADKHDVPSFSDGGAGLSDSDDGDVGASSSDAEVSSDDDDDSGFFLRWR